MTTFLLPHVFGDTMYGRFCYDIFNVSYLMVPIIKQ